MGDEDLRRLQRDAARGDAAAAARLARQQVRHGRPATWVLEHTWRLDDADRASGACFTADGASLLVITRKAVRILDPATGALRGQVVPGPLRAVGCAALWEDAAETATPPAVAPSAPSAGEDLIRVEVRERGPRFVRAHARPRVVVGEARDRNYDAGGSCAVTVSAVPPHAAPRVVHHFSDEVDAVAAGSDLAVAASGNAVRAWTGSSEGVIAWTNPLPVRALAVSAERRRVLIVGEGGASVRDLTGPDELVRFAIGLELLPTAALSRDGALALTATRAAVQVWEATSGALLDELRPPEAPLRGVTLSPGGVVAAPCLDRVALWHVDTGQPLGVTQAMDLPVVAAALDPSERTLVAVNPVRLWVFRRAD
jgi:hypothetical protein